MSFEQRNLRIVKKNVGKGWTKFRDALAVPEPIAVHQVAVTASEDCQITFGGPGAPATPTFSLLKGVPLVLPNTSDGWWEFDSSVDMGVLVATAAASIDVGILAIIKRA
jgi:hypothetical protein